MNENGQEVHKKEVTSAYELIQLKGFINWTNGPNAADVGSH